MPASQKPAIRGLALAVAECLEAYITVHNRIIEQAATWRSLVKDLFGRGVPMVTLAAEAEALVPRFTSVRDQ